MEPEISHRCPACGVAVRGTSLFCPQCGRPLKASAASGGGGKSAEATEATARVKPDTSLNTSALAPSTNLAETMRGKDALKPDAAVVENKRPTVGATVPLAREVEERAARQRATSTARAGSEGKKPARVEKLRSASSAMLEEASSDPSLRFVLVAIVIFLLSLLLLLLNHLLG